MLLKEKKRFLHLTESLKNKSFLILVGQLNFIHVSLKFLFYNKHCLSFIYAYTYIYKCIIHVYICIKIHYYMLRKFCQEKLPLLILLHVSLSIFFHSWPFNRSQAGSRLFMFSNMEKIVEISQKIQIIIKRGKKYLILGPI